MHAFFWILGVIVVFQKTQYHLISRQCRYKGNALLKLGKYDESIEAYNKAIELFPDEATQWFNKGKALQALNRTTEADEAFAKANELGYTG